MPGNEYSFGQLNNIPEPKRIELEGVITGSIIERISQPRKISFSLRPSLDDAYDSDMDYDLYVQVTLTNSNDRRTGEILTRAKQLRNILKLSGMYDPSRKNGLFLGVVEAEMVETTTRADH